MYKQLFSISIATIAAAGLLLASPIEVPCNVVAEGKIVPAKLWTLYKGTDGQLFANTINYKTGVSEGFSVAQFERGSEVRFSLSEQMAADRTVAIGDTVGIISDSNIEERLVVLEGELAILQANYAVDQAGAKEPVVQEAEQRLALSRIEAKEQSGIVRRLEQLFSQQLVSEEEYEVAKNKEAALQIAVSIAEAQLASTQMGAKPAYLNMIRTQIFALENEIGALRKRINAFTITSPVAGSVARSFSSDTLLVIRDTSALIAFMMVKLSDVQALEEVESVEITVPGQTNPFIAAVFSLDREVHVVNGEQVLIALAVLDDADASVMPGMAVRSAIACQKSTPLGFVKRFLE
ncbi:MAG: hypothetical protein AAF564_02585 [Bacteroidota bacterium]